MKKHYDIDISRRVFLGGLGLSLLVGRSAGGFYADGLFADDPPAGHGMLLFGERRVYLSHLPMYGGLTADKTDYRSPHRYQVILEVVFKNKAGEDVNELYLNDRRKNPQARVYTINPTERFVLTELAPGEKARRKFPVKVFRGHFERGGGALPELEDVTAEIGSVVHFRQFDPAEKSPERLEYILFGTPEEMFLAHYIGPADSFDQIIEVGTERKFSAGELHKGVRLSISEREDKPASRLLEKQKATAEAEDGKKPFAIEARREIYFEAGELRLNPTFEPVEGGQHPQEH